MIAPLRPHPAYRDSGIATNRFAPHTVGVPAQRPPQSRSSGQAGHGCVRPAGDCSSEGGEKPLEAFGWTGRRAGWIDFVCLHGGIFAKAQWMSFVGSHHEKVRRAVQRPRRAGRRLCSPTGREILVLLKWIGRPTARTRGSTSPSSRGRCPGS